LDFILQEYGRPWIARPNSIGNFQPAAKSFAGEEESSMNGWRRKGAVASRVGVARRQSEAGKLASWGMVLKVEHFGEVSE
jgi:hypothetical protein